ncbi:SpoIIE family protein phosphatase [Rhabdaerophilum sp. SD176]|uniref:SpoIIE family protein phosphatase n=1 Tax=Rhabdaerophilum sp. SD176 TaxID=2983548 RepID=UPI0024DF4180|nr:SpoIIE family protein phosphatase [Rhabdaerophilum sp. SD176]
MILFEASIPPDLLALSALRKDLSARLDTLCPADPVRQAILLTLSEIGANTILHADPAPETVTVRLSLHGASLSIDIEDDGGGFDDFDGACARSLVKQDHLFAESGRGLAIIQSMVDGLSYTPGLPNRLRATKRLAGDRPTILIVEDSPILLETYAAMLKGQYDILKAPGFDAAIGIAASQSIDGIVTDLHLEGHDGSALIDALEWKADRPPVPVLVLTGERDPDRLRMVFNAGVEQVLSKPVSSDALRNAVAAMLTRNARNNARMFRFFSAAIDREGHDDLPERIGPLRVVSRHARAGFGRGDFLCLFRRPGGHRLVLADVMGHGLAAQLAAMRFRAAMAGVHGAMPHLPCNMFLSALSRAMSKDLLLPEAFFSLVVADIDEDGLVALSAAGHPRPFMGDAQGITMVEVDGPFLGLFEEVEYPVAQVRLAPGQRLYLPTDGLDARSEQVGREVPAWLAEAMLAVRDQPLEAAGDRLEAEIRATLSLAPEDDWTLVMLEAAA